MSAIETTGDELSAEMLDLMEHEKVIDQGLAGFIEVGNALLAIREGKKYRAAGYATFEVYCQGRWNISREHGRRLIAAASVVSEMPPIGGIFPSREAQVRPLSTIADPDERAAAWSEAVEAAGGAQPTARLVEQAVARRQPARKEHPAVFSDAILETVAQQLAEIGTPSVVVDPFAGTGRVHELRERAGVDRTIGVELEPEWAEKHPDTMQGNALTLTHHVGTSAVDAIVTSPTYGNRMADHHDATDDSVRLTYKHTLGRDLTDGNSGALQWGEQYREFHRKAWSEAIAALRPGGTLTLNCKNHIRAGEVQRVTEWHIDHLTAECGLRLVALDVVPTKGLMAGANSDSRTPVEFVATFRKPA